VKEPQAEYTADLVISLQRQEEQKNKPAVVAASRFWIAFWLDLIITVLLSFAGNTNFIDLVVELRGTRRCAFVVKTAFMLEREPKLVALNLEATAFADVGALKVDVRSNIVH
jgi:hypothetical protein